MDHLFTRIIGFWCKIYFRCLTHYEVLEIPRTATKADIKKAFLEKAKKYHPDLNPDDEMAAIKFREVFIAWCMHLVIFYSIELYIVRLY